MIKTDTVKISISMLDTFLGYRGYRNTKCEYRPSLLCTYVIYVSEITYSFQNCWKQLGKNIKIEEKLFSIIIVYNTSTLVIIEKSVKVKSDIKQITSICVCIINIKTNSICYTCENCIVIVVGNKIKITHNNSCSYYNAIIGQE